MTFNKLFRTSVGADLSRPPPIYRPSVLLSLSGLFCYIVLSAPFYSSSINIAYIICPGSNAADY